jgi:predicted transcriptional regulator
MLLLLRCYRLEAPCEFSVKYLFPILRSEVSRSLIKKFKLTQMEVANRLGITQAAVSQYLNEKRGTHLNSLPENIQSVIQKHIDSIKDEEIKELNKEALRKIVCEICMKIQQLK